MSILLDGKKIAQEITEQIRKKITASSIKPRLAIILCGDNPDSQLYTSLKIKKCQQVGIETKFHHLPSGSSEEELITLIKAMNAQAEGVLIQLPLPMHLNTGRVVNAIDPTKDVDGLTATSIGKLSRGDESAAPATATAIIELLRHYSIPLQGKDVTIVNHSALIGKPLALMLLHRGATVTVCHEFTNDLSRHTRQAEILITAVGKAKLIRQEMVKEKAVVIDAGISRAENGAAVGVDGNVSVGGGVCGDVFFEEVSPKASYITPVPGGVGPMTVVMLLQNLVERAAKV